MEIGRWRKRGGRVLRFAQRQVTTALSGLRETYEARVAAEAFARAGRTPRLHGIVHELLFRDRFNHNPLNALHGYRALLSHNPRDPQVDIIIRRGIRVLRKLQLKDTPRSVRQVITRIQRGDYANVEVLGTPETRAAFNAAVKGQSAAETMGSSGISSAETARIAGKVLRRWPQARALAGAAGRVALAGGLIAAVLEAAASYGHLRRRRISRRQYLRRIIEEGIGGTLVGGGATAAASLATAGLPAALAAVGMTVLPVWVPLATGIGTALVTGMATKTGYDRLLGLLHRLVDGRAQAAPRTRATRGVYLHTSAPHLHVAKAARHRPARRRHSPTSLEGHVPLHRHRRTTRRNSVSSLAAHLQAAC